MHNARCIALAIDFQNPQGVIVLQVALLLAHLGFIFYLHKKKSNEVKSLIERIDQFIPKKG